MKQIIKKFIPVSLRRRILEFLNHFWVFICSHLPIKNRVLFFTIRADGKLLDNAKIVYDNLDCKKIVFAHMLPHSNMIKPAAYYRILTSKVIVTDDYCRYLRCVKLREGQKVFQIWHGCGAFKCFGLDVVSNMSKEQEIAAHSQYSAVAVTAEGCIRHFSGALGVSEKICLPVGMPRTDYLINNSESLKKDIYHKHSYLIGKKIFLYCPTFREENGERTEYNPYISWENLSSTLRENEIFIVCRHPLMNYNLLDGSFDNIKDLTGESTESLLTVADVFITDYSSLVYDAALVNVPTVFYCPDIDVYERHFYLDFPEDLPGDVIVDSSKLLSGIYSAMENPPIEKIKKFKELQLSACDGKSTERVVGIIRKWMNE